MVDAEKRSLSPLPFEEAAAWRVRLSADDSSDAEWSAFIAWLEANDVNRLAYQAVEAFDAEIEDKSAELLDLVRQTPASTDAPLAFHPVTFGATQAVRQNLFNRRTGIALALAASLALVAFLRWQPSENLSRSEYATEIGGHKEIALADGSHVSLNTNSRISFSFGDSRRTAVLARGEAVFEIAKDARRPFSISVADQKVEVVGTKFNILRRSDTTVVTVAAGIVKISNENTAGTAPERLVAGDEYTHRDGEPGGQLSKVDPANAFSWTGGNLVFKDAPLSGVVADLNRYYQRPIVIADEATKTLRFSGVIRVDDEEEVLHRLENLLPIAVQKEQNQVVLTRK